MFEALVEAAFLKLRPAGGGVAPTSSGRSSTRRLSAMQLAAAAWRLPTPRRLLDLCHAPSTRWAGRGVGFGHFGW